MIKAFFSNWAGAFRDSWGAARALPILLVLMIGIEGAQHVIELQLGFFSPDAAVRKAASLQPVRMAFGWPKMLILYAVGFVAMRWFVTRDAHAALRPSAMALRRWSDVEGGAIRKETEARFRQGHAPFPLQQPFHFRLQLVQVKDVGRSIGLLFRRQGVCAPVRALLRL